MAGWTLASVGNTPAPPLLSMDNRATVSDGRPGSSSDELAAIADGVVAVVQVAKDVACSPMPSVDEVVAQVTILEPDVVLKPLKVSAAKFKGVDAFSTITSKYTTPDGVCQVMNRRTRVVHLYDFGESSVCASWKCGVPDVYAKHADFGRNSTCWFEASECGFCVLCYSERSMLKLRAVLSCNGLEADGSPSSGVPSPLQSDSSTSGGEVSDLGE